MCIVIFPVLLTLVVTGVFLEEGAPKHGAFSEMTISEIVIHLAVEYFKFAYLDMPPKTPVPVNLPILNPAI